MEFASESILILTANKCLPFSLKALELRAYPSGTKSLVEDPAILGMFSGAVIILTCPIGDQPVLSRHTSCRGLINLQRLPTTLSSFLIWKKAAEDLFIDLE